MNNQDTLELLAEIDVPSLKVGLDLPLIESQDPEFVRKKVLQMKDLMAYSHTISLRKMFTVGGAPASIPARFRILLKWWQSLTKRDRPRSTLHRPARRSPCMCSYRAIGTKTYGLPSALGYLVCHLLTEFIR